MISSDEKRSARVEALWALGMAAVAFITPCLLLFAGPTTPDGTTPEWVLWAILLGWILAGSLGVARVIAGGRVRRMGAALIVGDATGALLFFVSIELAGALFAGE